MIALSFGAGGEEGVGKRSKEEDEGGKRRREDGGERRGWRRTEEEESTYTLSLARTVLGRRVDQADKRIRTIGLDVDRAAVGLVEAAWVLQVDVFAAVDAASVVVLERSGSQRFPFYARHISEARDVYKG